MITLAELNETFINNAREPFVKGILPVQPKEGFLPVIAMNTWKKRFRIINGRCCWCKRRL